MSNRQSGIFGVMMVVIALLILPASFIATVWLSDLRWVLTGVGIAMVMLVIVAGVNAIRST